MWAPLSVRFGGRFKTSDSIIAHRFRFFHHFPKKEQKKRKTAKKAQKNLSQVRARLTKAVFSFIIE